MSGLRLACYWIALRQELVISFIRQRPMEWDLSLIPIDYSLCAPIDDDNWANRIVVHCAHVITYSFDPEGDRSMARWRELKDQAERWRKNLPASFEPCWYAPAGSTTEDPLPLDTAKLSREDPPRFHHRQDTNIRRADVDGFQSRPHELGLKSALPQIWHLAPVHVIAHQHHLLGLILLAAHDPSIPRLGPHQQLRLDSVDSEIRLYLLELAGLAVSNSTTPTNMKTASMGIQMAGERLTNRAEQAAVYDILARTENEYRWPTTRARKELRSAWGWDR